MKKNKTIHIGFYLIISAMLFGCTYPKPNKEFEELTIKFYPAFSPDIQFSMIYNRKGGKAKLLRPRPQEKFEKYFKKNCDSIEFDVDSLTINKFMDSIFNGLILINHNSKWVRMFDGIKVKVKYIPKNNDTTLLDFWSPQKNNDYIVEYKLLDAVFELINTSLKDPLWIDEFEYVKGYFEHELPIYKTNDNPLTYKVWDMIGNKNYPLFKELMNKLPKDRAVIFNYLHGSFIGGWDAVIDMINLNHQNDSVYFLVPNFRKEEFQEFGFTVYDSIEQINQLIKR
jgi:hypothetical protein